MKTTIIAEAGVNHNGDIRLAKALIDSAANAGANYVKFQSFNADSLVKPDTPKAQYQIQKDNSNETQYTMLKKLELTEAMHEELIAYSRIKKIEFMSTAFDIKNVKMLEKFGQNVFKIPSGDITNFPLLDYIGKLSKKVILSTGMSCITEVEKAIEILEKAGTPRENITVLHCTSAYPAPYVDVNLLAMKEMADKLDVKVGYSDHTLGIQVAIAAVALGATVIEKHFTINKDLPGPDHKASLDPNELTQLVKSVGIVEESLGLKIKKPTISELENIKLIRKSIVAKQRILKGEIFSEENLTTKRPGNGISPMNWDTLIGTISVRDYEIDDLI